MKTVSTTDRRSTAPGVHRGLATAMRVLGIAAIFVAGPVASAQAAPGDLDTGFGTGGTVVAPVGAGAAPDFSSEAVPDRNGRTILVGSTGTAPARDFAVARFAADGRLDTSFDDDGVKVIDLGGEDRAQYVLVRPDGKLVVAGGSGAGDPDRLGIVRLNPDGSEDTSFSGDGMLVMPFIDGADFSSINSLRFGPQGDLVAAGTARRDMTTGFDMAVARYRANGRRDTSFGTNGQVTTSFERPNGSDVASEVEIQRDGKIVLAGDTRTAAGPNGFDLAVLRYNADGSPDTGFSEDGRTSVRFADSDLNDGGTGIAVQGNGKIVVSGVAGTAGAGGQDFALVRFNVDGTLDRGLSGDGRQTTDFQGLPDFGNDVTLQSDGRIVVAGTAILSSGSGGDFALARYNRNGSLDTTFGTAGKVTSAVAPGAGLDAAISVFTNADGIMVGGYSNANGESATDFALARYEGDRADLSVALRGPDGRVRRRRAARYLVAVRNDGPQAAPATRVELRLPRSVGFNDLTASQAGVSCEATSRRRATCPLGRLASGRTVRFTFDVRPRRARTIELTASVSSLFSDPNAGDNIATVTTRVVR